MFNTTAITAGFLRSTYTSNPRTKWRQAVHTIHDKEEGAEYEVDDVVDSTEYKETSEHVDNQRGSVCSDEAIKKDKECDELVEEKVRIKRSATHTLPMMSDLMQRDEWHKM